MSHAARNLGVSRTTLYRWRRRAGELTGWSCRPQHSPRWTSFEREAALLAAGWEWRWGADLVGALYENGAGVAVTPAAKMIAGTTLRARQAHQSAMPWNEARRSGQRATARELKGARFALWKNPEDLTGRQRGKLAGVARTKARLSRAYLLKEQLRQVFDLTTADALALLEAWLRWAWRCRIPRSSALARSAATHRAGTRAALTHRLSNALVESVNTKIRLITRVAFGFQSPDALIALALLGLGGYCPPLPGRSS